MALQEGQYENGMLNGWGRLIQSDGSYHLGWWRNGYACGWGIGDAFTYGEGICRGLYERDELIQDIGKFEEETNIDFKHISSQEFQIDDGLLKKIKPKNDPDMVKTEANGYWDTYHV